jgi:transposase
MDNASFHKSQDSQRLIEKVGCKVLFLPPYSPDLNPIEIFWANFKKMIQTNLEKFKTLAEAIDFSFSAVDGCMQNKI